MTILFVIYDKIILNCDQNGYTALLLAAYHGHLELVQLLLVLGSDINAINKVRINLKPCNIINMVIILPNCIIHHYNIIIIFIYVIPYSTILYYTIQYHTFESFIILLITSTILFTSHIL